VEELLKGSWTHNVLKSPHKLLNAFVHVIMSFTPIDGDDALLAQEPVVQFPTVDGFPWEKIKQGP
jgi:hypothetical protein